MPTLLDLYCCAGGAAVGYHRAGFTVTGVDNRPQPHYPFRFVQADALEYLAGHWAEYDAVHASPPCQDHSVTRGFGNPAHGTGWLLAATRDALQATPLPWVIENVPGAPMRTDYRLCGCLFDLPRLRRERWFETSWRHFELRPPCTHRGTVVSVAGHSPSARNKRRDGTSGVEARAEWLAAMGIDWMTTRELAQAIPPAYTQHIGAALLEQLDPVAGQPL